MTEVVLNMTIDFTDTDTLKSVHLKQGEAADGRRIDLLLTNNGESLNFSADDTVRFYARRDGGTDTITTGCAIFEHSIRISVSSNLTATAGVLHCEVRIEDHDKITITPTFDIIIDPSVSAIEDSTE